MEHTKLIIWKKKTSSTIWK